jgi:hypothetical protein
MQPIPTGGLRGPEDVIGIYASGLGAAIQNAEFRMLTAIAVNTKRRL